jgi:YegS/Rv2252/BmrU family lipid kinase
MLSLIVFRGAGGGRPGAALPAVTAALRAHGVEHRVEPTVSLDHARELAKLAAAAGETAVAFGGDGLIGAVAGALHGSGGVMGVLPGGRGNDLARVLGIPLDPVAACDVLRTGTPRTLDLGSANGVAFAGVASCGFDSDANRIANATRFIRGRFVYAYGGIRALIGWKPAHFELRLDGEPVSLTGYSVAIANSATYGGGMRIAPDASLDDGMFDVVTIAEFPKLSFLLSLPKVFRGTHVALAAVQVRRAREVEITADRPFVVYADGDAVAQLPVKLTVLRGAVRVIVPGPGGDLT